MRRLMDLISMFDSDTFANQRVRLFELKNSRPSDMEKSLQAILESISLDPKAATVKFLPIDKISTLIAVAPNPGVFDTVAQWIQKLDIPVTVNAGGIENFVYHVKYGRADCLAMALNSLFGAGGVYGPYGYGSAAPPPGYGTSYAYGAPYSNPYANGNGGYGGGYGGGGVGAFNGGGFGGAYGGGGTYGAPNSFMNGFGGAGACGSGMPGASGSSYGYPAVGGFSAQAPLVSSPPASGGQAAQPGAGGSAVPGAAVGAAPEIPPRIVANPLANDLIVQSDAQRYQSIQKVLQDLDVPPRQILLEARIYSIDLTDQFSSGVSAAFTRRNGNDTSFLGQLTDAASAVPGTLQLSAGALVGSSKQLLVFLNLNENRSHVHVLSEPSLIATDSIPAVINVGTQVPVSTGSTVIPGASGPSTIQNISGVSTGITLQVFARINPSGVVTLIVNQENSTPQNNSLTPTFSQQVVQTQITTVDGDTIAIGGEISESTNSSMSGIPLLSRIPYLGALFGQKIYSHERSELMLFMTPHVIRDQTELLEASNELRARVRKLQKYIKF